MNITYELVEVTREEFDAVQARMIADFTRQITGAEVTNQLLGTGKIVSCVALANSFETTIFTVHFDLDETKMYSALTALATGGLKLVDESLLDLWNSFMEVHNNLKHQLYVAEEETRRREKEAEKKAKQKEAQAKKKAEAKSKPAE